MRALSHFASTVLVLGVLIGGSHVAAAQPLTGTFVLGPNGDYADFASAALDLGTRGIGGSVVFEVETGIYTELVDLPAIGGVGPGATVTFRAQSSNASDVLVTATSQEGDLESVVTFAGADFVTFENLTIVAGTNLVPGTNLVAAISVTSGSNDITIRGCVLRAEMPTGITVHAHGTGISNLVIDDNTIEGTSNAVVLTGQFSRGDVTQAAISNNEIAARRGLMTSNTTGSTISSNRIHASSLSISTSSCDALTIANNFVTSDGVGISVLDANNDVAVLHNSVFVTDPSITTSRALAIGSANTAVRVVNNILFYDGHRGTAYQVDNPAALIISDFNNILSSGPFLASWNGNHRDLVDLQLASGMDANSISAFPSFVSQTDLHSPSPYVDGFGTPLPEVSTDIDGDARDLTNPDIGADEFEADPTLTPLAGSLTIGTGGDYTTITSAVTDVALRGVGASVVFTIAPGEYSEQVDIPSIPGASSQSNVTFRSQTGSQSDVALRFDPPSSQPNSFVVRFKATDFVHLEDITIEVLGSGFKQVVALVGRATHNEIRRSRLVGGSSALGIYTQDTPDFVRIIDNTIEAGGGIEFDTNTFIPRTEQPEIHGNELQGLAFSFAAQLRIVHADGARITGNSIASGPNGIHLLRCTGVSRPSLLANNFVAFGVANIGIRIQLCDNLAVVYNSVHGFVPNGSPVAFRSTADATNLTLRNNIFATTGPNTNGTALHVENPASIVDSDHNNLFVANGNVAFWDGAQSTLAQLQMASGLDANSVSIDPSFASDDNLHLRSAALNGLASPFVGITDDIDGDLRDSTSPDIGADEFDPIAVVGPIADLNILEDSGSNIVVNDLNEVFASADAGQQLTFSAQSSDPAIAVSVAGTSLVLEPSPNFFGFGTITVTAQIDSGQFTTDDFVATVDPVNDPPFVANGLGSQIVPPNFDPFTIDLRTVFDDIDTAVLTYEVQNDGKTNLTIVGDELRIESIEGMVGISPTTLTASDGEFSVDASFDVRIVPPPAFTLLSTNFPQVRSGGVDWGDYDGDGDLDALFSGRSSDDTPLGSIQANFDGLFLEAAPDLEYLMHGDAEWGDFDNDGDLDFILIGRDTELSTHTYVYRNIGSSFELFAELLGVTSGDVDWIDFDHDGDLDISLAGAQVVLNTPATRLYRNDLGRRFVEVPTALPAVQLSSLAWDDYDLDGDMDVLISGVTDDLSQVTDIYRNDGETFVPINIGVVPLARVSAQWGDFDADGDPDLVLAGFTPFPTSVETTTILRNDAGAFVDIGADLVGIRDGTVAWADYDVDGDLDLLISGRNGTDTHTVLYRNDAGTFVEAEAGFFPSLSNSSFAWGDMDDDDDLDLIVSGQDSTGTPVTALYQNNAVLLNARPSVPQSLQASPTATSASLSWSAATDAETPGAGLTYNVRVGTTPGGGDVMSAMVNPDGTRQVAEPGNARYRTQFELAKLDPLTTYHWSVQAIDNVNAPSGFAIQSSFTTSFAPFTELELPFADLVRFASAWGDYDNDGDLDLLICGADLDFIPFAALYENESGDFFEVNSGVEPLSDGDAAWGDFDRDGDLDLLVCGYDAAGVGQSILYRNDDGNLVDSNAGLVGVGDGEVAWGDFDQDGDLDIALSGAQFLVNTPHSAIYRNTDGQFDDIGAGLTNLQVSGLAWADYDNDGDLDLLQAGFGDGIPVTELYRNDDGSFVLEQTGIVGLALADVAWGDHDNDGDMDILINGRAGTNPFFGAAKVFRNDGPGESGWRFVDTEADFENVNSGAVAWGDFDNDGDLDALVAGRNTDEPPFARSTRLYRNDGPGFSPVAFEFMGMSNGHVEWGDVDGDLDLDLVVGGFFPGDGRPRTRLYLNNTLVPNTPPSTPQNPSATSGILRTTLSWDPATDSQTPPAGLSYNVRVGSAPGAGDIVTAHVNATDARQVAQSGNAGQRTSFSFRNPFPGTYFWSVQAIDSGLSGSGFAAEQTIAVELSSLLGSSRVTRGIVSQSATRDTIDVGPGPTALVAFAKAGSEFVVRDVKLTLKSIAHPHIEDLRISLVHDGVSVAVFSGSETAGQDMTETVFLDSANGPIASGQPPFTGSFRPREPLANLAGSIPGGNWVLEIVDNGVDNVGTLESWSVEILFGPREDPIPVPRTILLSQNYPNPFNPLTTIEFSLPHAGPVTLIVYDPAGREVRSLVGMHLEPGPYVEEWNGLDNDGRAVASGIYYYCLTHQSGTTARKMVLIR